MATNRLQLLQQMVSQDPNNSFARYGLAMELKNSGDFDESITDFRKLLEAKTMRIHGQRSKPPSIC